MKPDNWNKLSQSAKRQIALQLLQSFRGSYLISQALSIAVEQMKKIEPPHREESNMEMLLETLFPVSCSKKSRGV
jgi:hypothetical protein